MLPLLAIGAGLSFVGSAYGGYSAFKSAQDQSASLLEQGRIRYQESLREANIIREEGENFAAKQSLAFIGAGFQLTGSPLITLAQTKKYAQTEAKATERRGFNEMRLAEKEAKRVRSEGRAQLISGILGGAGSALNIAGKGF